MRILYDKIIMLYYCYDNIFVNTKYTIDTIIQYNTYIYKKKNNVRLYIATCIYCRKNRLETWKKGLQKTIQYYMEKNRERKLAVVGAASCTRPTVPESTGAAAYNPRADVDNSRQSTAAAAGWCEGNFIISDVGGI